MDNGCTPYILVDASLIDVLVPRKYVKDDQIVLNISPDAVVDLTISNEAVAFNGRFGGVAEDVYVPIAAIAGIYARENGQGMVFDPEEVSPPPDEPPPEPKKQEKKPALKIVR